MHAGHLKFQLGDWLQIVIVSYQNVRSIPKIAMYGLYISIYGIACATWVKRHSTITGMQC